MLQFIILALFLTLPLIFIVYGIYRIRKSSTANQKSYWLHLIIGIWFLCIGLTVILRSLDSEDLFLYGEVFLIPAVIHFILAWGAKIGSKILNFISILVWCVHLIGFPIGTIIGYFGLKYSTGSGRNRKNEIKEDDIYLNWSEQRESILQAFNSTNKADRSWAVDMLNRHSEAGIEECTQILKSGFTESEI